jgi:hypothetical protein
MKRRFLLLPAKHFSIVAIVIVLALSACRKEPQSQNTAPSTSAPAPAVNGPLIKTSPVDRSYPTLMSSKEPALP